MAMCTRALRESAAAARHAMPPPVAQVVRVFVVDDDAGFLAALVGLIDVLPGTEMVGRASGVLDALERLPALAVDVLVCDLRMADGGGPRVVRTLRERGTPIRIVATSAGAVDAHVRDIIDLGADRFVPKSASAAQWLDALIPT